MKIVSGIQIYIVLLAQIFLAASFCPAQQGAATGEPLVVETKELPKSYLRQSYRFELDAQGGIRPLNWKLASGTLPAGMDLKPDGRIAGTPMETGLFHFTVTVTDSGRPAHERNHDLTLQVVAPLFVQWSNLPKVIGSRLEGSVKISNQTGDDFDLTVVMLAVNEIGRATAIGYQHFTLKAGTMEMEIPYGENLPRGAYDLHVDAIAEVPATNTIYRARLVAHGKQQVQQGP